MKKLLFISSIIALSMAATFSATAQVKGNRPSISIAETNTVKAIVQDIDHAKREVTLKGPKGNTVKLKVSEEAKNFSRVQKGDEVLVSYYEAAAISLAEPGEAVSATSEETVRRAGEGQKPGGTATTTITVVATVENIDRSKREVTLKGPEGESTIVKVDPSIGDLTRIKEGDRIKATYTEGLAISVDKANK